MNDNTDLKKFAEALMNASKAITAIYEIAEKSKESGCDTLHKDLTEAWKDACKCRSSVCPKEDKAKRHCDVLNGHITHDPKTNVLKKIFELIEGPWDCVVISEDIYDEIKASIE